MPCETKNLNGITLNQRKKQINNALARLESLLTNGQVILQIGPSGSIVFVRWSAKDRDFVSDVCAYRALTKQGSQALRRAVIRAQIAANRSINESAILSGTHSHDNGQTWGTH